MSRTNRKRHEPIIDALPEFFPYRDTGCEVAPSCLKCPLPQCKYDDPTAYQRTVREQRDLEVLRVRRSQRTTVPQLAQHFDVSQRTIHRILQRIAERPMDHSLGDSLEESHVGPYSQPDVSEKSTRNGQMDTPLQLHLLQQEAAH